MKKLIAIGAGILLLTFGIGYVVAARVLFPPLPEPEDGIVVPDLTGNTTDAARSKLQALGLAVSETMSIAHPTQPPGVVVAQSPLPGQQLRSGGQVRLGLSGGLPRVQVPDVVGFNVERATTVLTQLGLSADQRPEVSDRPAGTVLRIIPEAGQNQPVPGRVMLVVSSGPPAIEPVDSTLPPDTLTNTVNGPRVQQ